MKKRAKHLFIVTMSCFILISCKKETVKSVPATDSTSIITHSLKSDSAIINPSDTLNNLVDKSVIGTHLLTESSITPRLKTLLGSDFDQMVKYWNTETPFTKEGDVLHASGCKQHDCNTYSYDLYIDTKNNKINVYKFSQSKLTVFAEDDFRIALKDSLLQDLNTKKLNATIPKEK
ncbi:hypothetical protein [Flavobacterium sp. Root420]|uniref:hypothetical protein n=1 Tax=Flavobacterium sp. Root420 TaxID=1736533 RepID=UPI0006FC82F4|nr:hypothetical protein [Flavobacterium sp. Root420]KQW98984.1 hypothetical protein ASC72_12735 [Flavobacterium sp. Root420]